MGTETSKASLFDKHLVSDLINKVKKVMVERYE